MPTIEQPHPLKQYASNGELSSEPSLKEILDAINSPAEQFVANARSIGRSLSPEELLDVIPEMLRCGIRENLRDRAVYAINLALGANEPYKVLSTSNPAVPETVWRRADDIIRSKEFMTPYWGTFLMGSPFTALCPHSDIDPKRVPGPDYQLESARLPRG